MLLREENRGGRFWRRAATIVVQVLLITIILGLIVAMWLPAHVGVTTEKRGGENWGFLRGR